MKVPYLTKKHIEALAVELAKIKSFIIVKLCGKKNTQD